MFLKFSQLLLYSQNTHHGVPYILIPQISTPESSKYVQLFKCCLMFSVLTASSIFFVVSVFDFVFLNILKKVHLSSEASSKFNPVCLEPRASFFLNMSEKAGSKLSSWLPAITILCLCGNVPEVLIGSLEVCLNLF